MSFCMRCRTSLRSVSICVSPGPRVPMPPPRRSRCVHCPASLGSRYSCCANSTCRRPSLVRARCAKTSRISAVRSMTFAPPSSFSRLRCCVGVSSSSQITVLARFAWRSPLSSSSLPLPMYVCVGLSMRCVTVATTMARALLASSASSVSDSSSPHRARLRFSSTPTRIARSSLGRVDFIRLAIFSSSYREVTSLSGGKVRKG